MPDRSGDQRRPQDAFEELARMTLADHSLKSVMEKVALLTKRTVPGATEVSVTLTAGGKASTVAFTGQLAMDLDERQYKRGYGPCLSSIEGGEPVLISSMEGDSRWSAWSRDAVKAGAGSSLSIPVPLQREVGAALNIYSTDAAAFDEASIELAQTFAAYAGVALANMHLHEEQGKLAEQLRTAVESRATIEQAKGILMGQRRCSSVEAFNILIRLSQASNHKLGEVAQALVDEAEWPET